MSNAFYSRQVIFVHKGIDWPVTLKQCQNMSNSHSREATKFRQWRSLRGYTLREVAALTGFSTAMISCIERGKRSLMPDSKVRIARRLRVNLDELFEQEP